MLCRYMHTKMLIMATEKGTGSVFADFAGMDSQKCRKTFKHSGFL
jgi:hypothetical protein